MGRNLKRRTLLKSVGEAVTFGASGSGDFDGSVASYDWAFGDGETVTHSCGSSSEYTAALTDTDDDGATGTDSVSITARSGFSGDCGAAYDYEHADEGRAYQDTSTCDYYAVGSDDYLGSPDDTSTLKETAERREIPPYPRRRRAQRVFPRASKPRA